MSGPGWGNPVVGGTTLRIPAIQSPNFSMVNQTGWAIFADGSAFFFNIFATGSITGGSLIIDGTNGGVFVYSGPPALGNLIGSWAGAAGTDTFGNHYPQGLNVTQGSISGTVFSGTTFIINTLGIFFYTAAPALGNLGFTIASSPGTDGFGNVYKQGITAYGTLGSAIEMTIISGIATILLNPQSVIHQTVTPQVFSFANFAGTAQELDVLVMTSGKQGGDDAALQLFGESFDGTIPAEATIEFGGTIFCTISKNGLVLPGNPTPLSVPGSMLMFSDPTGSMRVLDGTDSQIYATERKSLGVGATFGVTSTTPVSVFSLPVAAAASGPNNYRYDVLLLLTPNQSAGAIGIGVNCTAAGSVGNHTFWTSNSPSASAGTTILSRDGLGLSATPLNIGLTMSTAGSPVYAVHINGFLTVAANTSGNFQVLANIGTAGDTYNVHPGSYVDLMPS